MVCVLLSPVRADVWAGFQAEGSDAASTTITWTNANFSVPDIETAGGDFDEIRYGIPMSTGELYGRLRVENP